MESFAIFQVRCESYRSVTSNNRVGKENRMCTSTASIRNLSPEQNKRNCLNENNCNITESITSDNEEEEEERNESIEIDNEEEEERNESIESDNEEGDRDTSVDGFRKLHGDTECTVTDAMLMIYAFSVRHSLTWVATEDLTRLVNKVIGSNVLSPSKYHFKKKFKSSKNQFVTHIICHFCNQYLGDLSDIVESNVQFCSNCHTEIQIDTKYKKNHFITIPIEPHLKNVLRQNIGNLHLNLNTKMSANAICDVHDSAHFLRMKAEMAGKPFITLTVSTDGARVFESASENSLWPIQFIINEIDLENRFKRENIVCSAFSFGKTPNMQIFFKSFIEEINNINAAGGIKLLANGQSKLVKVFPMIFTADTPAKSHILNKINFNGYKGCPYCLHEGTLVNGQIRYCKRDEAQIRINQDTRADMLTAQITKKRHNGYTGSSPLICLDHTFDIVWQVGIDKMHSVDIGAFKRLIELFLNKKNQGKP